MKKSFYLFGTLAVLGGMTLPIAANRVSAAAADSAAGSTDNGADRLPIDVARGSLGATLQVREPKGGQQPAPVKGANQSAQGLISDDAALSYPLAQGTTSMILSLHKADVLSRLNFINYGAEGKLTISASATKLPFDSTEWRPVARAQEFGGSKVIGCDLGSLEARYVKMDFETQTPGRISGLGVFGLMTINTLEPRPAGIHTVSANPGANTAAGSMGGNVFYDVANLNSGAKVVQVSRGGSVSSAQALLDGNVETNYTFDPTDPAPTVVIDFNARRSLSRVSCVYQAPPGRIDFYLVDNPYTSDYGRSASLAYVSEPSAEPADTGVSGAARSKLAAHKAICSIDTTGQSGLSRASADVGGASGRFLVAEFHPVATGRHVSSQNFKDVVDTKDFKDGVDAKDFKDAGAAPAADDEGQPLRLISLSAFGDSFSGDTISRVPNVPPPNIIPPPPQGGTAQQPVVPPVRGGIISD